MELKAPKLNIPTSVVIAFKFIKNSIWNIMKMNMKMITNVMVVMILF